MDNKTFFQERRAQLILEYVSENKNARRGKRNVFYSLWAIFVLKLLLALFEIPTFIILHKPLNILSILLVFPLMFVLGVISRGAKGFTYVILVTSTLRLVVYFAAIYKNLPECALTNAYSFILFGILILQFFISLFLLVSFDCDTYFAAAQRISIKVHAETEKLKAASKHEPRREQHDGLEETSESPL